MKTFHKGKKPWAKIKHGILSHYLPLFVNKLAYSYPQINMVDGFAGAGSYEDGQPGSALISAEIASNPLTERSRGVLRCINVEKNAEAFASLEAATKPQVDQGIVLNIKGAFEKELPAILNRIHGESALFFIDPFGTNGATISTLERIFARRGPTEVLLRFDSARVKRLLAYNKNAIVGLDDAAARTEERFRNRVLDLTGIQGVKAALSKNPQAPKIIVESYIKVVTEEYHLFKYGMAYPVVNPKTGRQKYFLVHFCNHPDGFVFMANFMAEMQRTIDKGVVGDPFGLFELPQKVPSEYGQSSMFDLLGEAEPKSDKDAIQKRVREIDPTKVRTILKRLPDIILKHALHGQTVQRRRLYAAIVEDFEWHVLLKEIKQALKDAQPHLLTLLPGSEEKSKVQIHTPKT